MYHNFYEILTGICGFRYIDGKHEQTRHSYSHASFEYTVKYFSGFAFSHSNTRFKCVAVSCKMDTSHDTLHADAVDDVMNGPADDWSRVSAGRLVPADFYFMRDQSSCPIAGPIIHGTNRPLADAVHAHTVSMTFWNNQAWS